MNDGIVKKGTSIKSFKNFNQVAQDNLMIKARSKITSVREQKLILSLLSEIKRSDKTLPVLHMDIDYLVDYLGLKGKDAYKSLKTMTEKILHKTLIVNDKTKDKEDHELQTTWFSKAEYFKSINRVEFRFCEDLLPYLIGLSNNFTTFQLKNFMSFKNKYAFKIYMVLRRWLNDPKIKQQGYLDITLKEFKKILMIDRKKAYKNNPGNIKKKVLSPARDEINKSTDIYVDIQLLEQKNRFVGRSPMGMIRFWIKDNPNCTPSIPPTKELPFSDDEKASFKKSPLQKLIHDIQQQENLIRNIKGKLSPDELNLQKLKLEQLKLEIDGLKKGSGATN